MFEKKMLNRVKKLTLKIIKFGAKLDEFNIPFEFKYQNSTFLRQKGER